MSANLKIFLNLNFNPCTIIPRSYLGRFAQNSRFPKYARNGCAASEPNLRELVNYANAFLGDFPGICCDCCFQFTNRLRVVAVHTKPQDTPTNKNLVYWSLVNTTSCKRCWVFQITSVGFFLLSSPLWVTWPLVNEFNARELKNRITYNSSYKPFRRDRKLTHKNHLLAEMLHHQLKRSWMHSIRPQRIYAFLSCFAVRLSSLSCQAHLRIWLQQLTKALCLTQEPRLRVCKATLPLLAMLQSCRHHRQE